MEDYEKDRIQELERQANFLADLVGELSKRVTQWQIIATEQKEKAERMEACVRATWFEDMGNGSDTNRRIERHRATLDFESEDWQAAQDVANLRDAQSNRPPALVSVGGAVPT